MCVGGCDRGWGVPGVCVCVCRGRRGTRRVLRPRRPPAAADVSVSSSIGSAAAASRTPRAPTHGCSDRQGHPRVPGMVAAAGG